MHGYDNFHLDVLDAFDFIIKKYRFSVEVIDKNAIVVLTSTKCILSFDMDRMDLNVSIKDPNSTDSRDYALVDILCALVPIDKRKNNDTGSDKLGNSIKDTLVGLSRVILNNLTFILEGDFSWNKKYQQFMNDQRFIIKKLGQNFTPKHPIYKKILSGDSSWRDDLLTL